MQQAWDLRDFERTHLYIRRDDLTRSCRRNLVTKSDVVAPAGHLAGRLDAQRRDPER
jgi:hypothetical protein